MQFYAKTRTHVRQCTLVHVAKFNSTISWIMSSYFPRTGFKATVRAWTGDNRYNCAPNRWGYWLVCESTFDRRNVWILTGTWFDSHNRERSLTEFSFCHTKDQALVEFRLCERDNSVLSGTETNIGGVIEWYFSTVMQLHFTGGVTSQMRHP